MVFRVSVLRGSRPQFEMDLVPTAAALALLDDGATGRGAWTGQGVHHHCVASGHLEKHFPAFIASHPIKRRGPAVSLDVGPLGPLVRSQVSLFQAKENRSLWQSRNGSFPLEQRRKVVGAHAPHVGKHFV